MVRVGFAETPPHPPRKSAATSPRKRGEVKKKSAVRIGIDQRAPAGSVKRLPCPFGLREAIGDGIDHGWMMTHPAMAAFDLDALRLRGGLLHAALPGADAVGAAEDRGGRHRRGDRQGDRKSGG